MDNFNKREELDTEVYPPENTNNNQEYVPQQNYQAPQQNYSEQPSYNAQPNYVAAPYNPYGNADSMENPYGEPAPAPKKKLGLILGIVGGAVALILTIVLVIILMQPSVEELIADGKYAEAYEEAETKEEKDMVITALLEKGDYAQAYNLAVTEEEKDRIIEENAMAVVSAQTIDSMKDPDSFELTNYWHADDGSFVLQVTGNNSYGNPINNYWYFTYDEDDGDFLLWDAFIDFTEDKIYSWDDSDEVLEKRINNYAKNSAKEIVKGTSVSQESVARINGLAKSKKISGIKLLDATKTKLESEE